MTDEKLYQVLDYYEQELAVFSSWRAKHLMEMIPKMRVFIKENRREKVMRWLGFIQGVLWSDAIFTLDELKKHNMPGEL